MKKFLLFFIIVVGVLIGGFNEQVFASKTLENLPEFYIKAVNPGYTVDSVQNVGEMIEIGRNSNDIKSLAGLKIGYINSSGNEVLLADFSKYLWKAGETIQLRLASSPGSELAQVLYTKTLAFKAGPLKLIWNDEVIDSVCWTGKSGCYDAFSSSRPTTLVRNVETGDFEHVSDYEPDKNGVLEALESDDSGDVGDSNEIVAAKCKGVVFSEILSYYENLQSEQFVELYNGSVENVFLDGCSLRYKNKLYPLSGMIKSEGYFVRLASDFKLTKNPASSNVLELVDANGEVLDKLEYFNGQRKGTSYALIGYDANGLEIWKMTYAPTPGEANNFQEFRTCEEGKVLNEATGNCVKATSIAEKICGEGQYLNILTGRCKKIPEGNDAKTCKEGYYLNPETGRCKKIVENDGADYTLVPETYTEESNFVALYLVLGVLGLGLFYIGYEFRHDIMRIIRRLKWW